MAEQSLAESRKWLSDIIEFLPDATLVIDRDGKVIAWNRAIEAMTRVKAEKMLGKGDYEYALPFYGERRPILIDLALHPDPEREKGYTAIRRTGDIIFGEAYTPKLPPGNVHLSATASVLRDAGGKIIAAIECIRNNTERKNLEAQLQQAQKMEAIGTLAGGIAHDFNNLLMAIQGNTSLMLMNTDFSDLRYEKLKAIEDQVIAGAGLTKQILGFARVGKYELKPIDMNDVVEKSSTMFGRTKKEILIHKKFEKNLWAVEADTPQMDQIFMNLYVNAWQAMPGGGHIYLETSNLTITETDGKFFYMKPGRYVRISVNDTGVGMDEKTKGRIFEPFFTTKEMGRGTGLGLAMVYGIVKGHNGFINVYSEEGKGTTFNIYLPASEKEVLKEEKPEDVILKGRETILLVDDERAIIDVTREILEALGYLVLVAANGREALKLYQENRDKIDVVILDMIMPDMGGGETFDRLKEIKSDIKVILSSGYSLDGEASGIMARGCRGFIQKPSSIAVLSQKVREVLGGKVKDSK
jgi:PAS domain S-box-containing protein